MNAPLPEHIRKALDSVTLDDKLRSGLHHKDIAGGKAAGSGFGGQQAEEGDAV